MAVPIEETAAGQVREAENVEAIANRHILSGDSCSLFRIVLINEFILELVHTIGIQRYQTVGGNKKKIGIGDLVILETFRSEDLYDLFEGFPDSARVWRKCLTINKVDDMTASAWTRIFGALPLAVSDGAASAWTRIFGALPLAVSDGAGDAPTESRDESEDASETSELDPNCEWDTHAAVHRLLRNLHGYSFLPEAIQGYLRMCILDAADDEGADSVASATTDGESEPDIHAARQVILEFSLDSAPPRRRRRKLYEQELEEIFRNDLRVTLDQFPDGWSRPTELAIERCMEKIDDAGFNLNSLANVLGDKVDALDSEEA